ncbi:hypothetical protein WJX75_005421 [Coccomyxa subellipsoidea]|uniref:Prolyl 4-hydroxylase alpha subunit Fe(2+) 2OG dioxygenase domain-containing protein n=1 Tax=Coccomyxa subellipsoidea TaxID=248742 RepID=A0ABR2YRE9_9CHLO
MNISQYQSDDRTPHGSFREVCPRRRLQSSIELGSIFEASESFLAEEQLSEARTLFHTGTQPSSVNLNVLYVFNSIGMQKYGVEEGLESSLLNIFQQLRHRRANFWKLQLNHIWPSSRPVESELGTKDAHVDHWVLHNNSNTCRILAFQTSILYITVPQGMRGGELVLYKKGINIVPGMTTNRLMTVTPAENLLIKFQGDLPHQVQDFVTEDQRPRVSIALEQFYIPDELYQHAVEFDVIRPPGV